MSHPVAPTRARCSSSLASALLLYLCSIVLGASTGLADEHEVDVGEEPQREILAETKEDPEPEVDPDLDPDFDADELRGARTEGVEEITVTGEVLESSTQADTQAITTFDQAELDTLGIADVDTLALNTPSLHVGQVGSQAVITLRGIGLENLTSVGEAGVGFGVDGVHMGRPSAANAAFFDLERVDVERGPQGIMGGRNLTGGKIQLWSKKPTEDFEAFGDFEYGNYDSYTTRAVVNLPLLSMFSGWEDKLMTRASILWTRRDGFQHQKFTGVEGTNADDSKDFAGRFQARSLWFDQTLELRGIGTYSQQKGRGPALKLLGDPPQNIAGTVGLAKQRQDDGLCVDCFDDYVIPDCPSDPPFGFPDAVCIPGADRQTYQDQVNDQDNDQNGFTGMLNWDMPFFLDTPLSDMRFGMIGSYQVNNTKGATDFDGTNWPDTSFFQQRDADQHSIEVFIERPDVGMFDFKVGFYYYKEDIKSNVCFDSLAALQLGDLGLQADIKTTSKAGFGTVGFRPIDEVRVFAGIRYTDEEKKAVQINENYTTLTQGEANAIAAGTSSVDDFIDSRNGRAKVSRNDCGRQFLDTYGFTSDVPGERGWLIIDRQNSSPDLRIDSTWSAWTPGVGIDWQVTPDSTLGFSATRGWKAGGFPLGAEENLNPDLQDPYPPEKVWEFELTSKNEFFDGLLRFNTTLFWTEYDPFQICQFSGPVFFCRGDGGATIRGIEVEFLANPIDGLQLNGFFNVLDTRVNDYQIIDPTIRSCSERASLDQIERCEAGDPNTPPLAPSPPLPTDVSGNQLPKAPKWAGSFGAQYTIDMGRFGFLTPRAQTQFQGRTYFRVFNRQEFSQEKFIKVDLKVTWRSEDDRFWAETFVTNLTDVNVINSMFVGPQATGGQVLTQIQPPRTYGFRVGVNYISDWVDRIF